MKYTKDHPAFIRVSQKIRDQIQTSQAHTVKTAMASVMKEPPALSSMNLIERVSERVDELENRMEKRMRRYYGLTGRYVGH